jgi:hypothetical protein
LRQPPDFIEQISDEQKSSEPIWARFWLSDSAMMVRKRIFKGLFYACSLFGVVFFLLMIGFAIASMGNSDFVAAAVGMLINSAFYVGLGLLFRRASLRVGRKDAFADG